jgi:hypothetical protein
MVETSIRDLRAIAFSVLLLKAAGNGAAWAERLDLERLLTDPKALAKLVIEYEPGDTTSLFIYGTGAVVKQARPLASDALVPTCNGRVGQNEVKELVGTFIRDHFFDLPIRSYFYMTASDEDDFWKALKIHSITIDDGETRAARQFAEGVYQSRKEPIPRDFATIEEVLRRIEQQVTEGKPCHVSPGIKRPPLPSPQPAPASLPS